MLTRYIDDENGRYGNNDVILAMNFSGTGDGKASVTRDRHITSTATRGIHIV